jgi:hypothetical protein
MVAGSRTCIARSDTPRAGAQIRVRFLIRKGDWTLAAAYTAQAKLLASKASSAGSTEAAGRVAGHDTAARQLSTSAALRA